MKRYYLRTIFFCLIIVYVVSNSKGEEITLNINYINNNLSDTSKFDQPLAPVKVEFSDCRHKTYMVDNNCEFKEVLEKSIFTPGEVLSSPLVWEVKIDLWDDGSFDYMFASDYEGPDGSEYTIHNGIIKKYRIGINEQYSSLKTTAREETLRIEIPEKIIGRFSIHSIVWSFRYGSGYSNTCKEKFTVLDKKPPTPICVPLSTAFLQDPDGNGPLLTMTEIWAIDFMGKAYDNCTGEDDLLFTFDDWAPQIELKFDANGNPMSVDHPHFFGANGGVASAVNPNASAYTSARAQYLAGKLQLWIPSNRSSAKVLLANDVLAGNYMEVDLHVTVWDKKFNHDYCWTTLKNITEPNLLVGKVTLPNGSPVKGINVYMEGDFQGYTNDEGVYILIRPWNEDFSVYAYKDDDALRGVSTLDVMMIERHADGSMPLKSPWQMVAADINNDKKVTKHDAIQLKRIIVDGSNKFPENTSWRFPVKAQNISPENPFPYEDTIRISSFDNECGNLDFYAVKVGDVSSAEGINGPNDRNISNREQGLVLQAQNSKLFAAVPTEIPVYAKNFEKIFGFQFNLLVQKATVLDVLPGKIKVEEDDFKIHKGGVRVVYTSGSELTITEGEILFTVVILPDELSFAQNLISVGKSDIIPQSYTSDLSVGDVNIEFRTAPEEKIELIKNEPNPFRESTTISFIVPEKACVKLNVYDISGKLMVERNIDANQGLNKEVFNREEIGATGIFLFTLTSKDYSVAGKIIVSD